MSARLDLSFYIFQSHVTIKLKTLKSTVLPYNTGQNKLRIAIATCLCEIHSIGLLGGVICFWLSIVLAEVILLVTERLVAPGKEIYKCLYPGCSMTLLHNYRLAVVVVFVKAI